MPSFVHPALLWGLALLAVPVLIHLINSLRHRPVEWAAMEFLLASQKRSRTWVLVKQLLLLAARMAAIAAVVLMVAQPSLEGSWLSSLGGARVHHVLLLDDSFSMTDRQDESTAFGAAVEAVRQIAARTGQGGSAAVFSLVRASCVVPGQSPRPDLWKQPAGAELAARLEQTLRGVQATWLDVKPQAALAGVAALLDETPGESTEIFLLSDFRQPDWQDDAALAGVREQLAELRARVHLVRCVERQHENLAVAALKTLPGPYAAGVPLSLEVSVQNFGQQAARGVVVRLSEDGQTRPGVQFDEIAPGKTETRRFQVQWAAAGVHEVSASLDADAVEADNRRDAVLDVPLKAPVLLVDGGAETADARFVAHALAPGGSATTGFAPVIEAPAALATRPLAPFHSVWLLNTGYLETAAVEALEEYVRQGGGLAIVCGERTDAAFTNGQLYRDGQGPFPAPLTAPRELLVDRLETPPDIEPGDHPMFRVFAGERNSFLGSVAVETYWGLAEGWPAADATDRQVIARLRNGAPLAIERSWGDGAVVALLTTAAPRWNNWARNPSFVVALLELASHLGGMRPRVESQPVGTAVDFRLDPADYAPRIEVQTPQAARGAATTLDATADAQGLAAQWAETLRPGVYRFRLTKHDGQAEERRAARHVQAAEGDTRLASSEDLAEALSGVDFEERPVRGLEYAVGSAGGASLSRWLLVFLAALLAGEQLLAWSASYHPSSRAGGGR